MDVALAQQSFPQIYERLLVPAIFTPWARDLIERSRPIGPSDRILDLGCGTGIVSRLLRERLGGAARLTALDANPQMAATARSLAPELDVREGNAMALPFDDGSFDLVLSQEMLQFVPDRPKALAEIRRVLAPGGRVFLSTWRPRAENELIAALGPIAERHLGPSNDKRYSLGDGDVLRALLVEAGFTNVIVETVSRSEHFTSFPARLNLAGMGYDVASLAPETLAAVEAESAEVFARLADGDGISARSSANVASAVR